MRLGKRITALVLVLLMLCTTVFAAPASSFPVFTDTPAMQYLKLSQIESVLCSYHLDSGYNDRPMIRAYRSLTGASADLSDNALRKAILLYLARDEANYDLFAKEMCSLYDEYSAFMTAEEYLAAFPDSGDYKGIGVTVRAFGGTLAVTEVHEGSPAELAGLEVNDRIVKIGTSDLRLLDYSESTALMAKSSQNACTLTVRKYTTDEEVELTLTPAPIDIPNVEYRLLEEGIGYIRINRFSGEEYMTQLNDTKTFVEENNVSKVVLDLRDNPGGDLSLLLNTISFFIPDENILLFKAISRGNETTYRSAGIGIEFDDIAILVNGSSASSSEVCAGVLSDTSYATIFGTTTFGKARGQSTLQLADENLLHLSLSEVSLPVRGKYHGIGVKPDVESDLTRTFVLNESDLASVSAVDASSDAEEILLLQKRLYALGYLGAYTLGVFDDATVNALNALLRSLEKVPSGVCTYQTMETIIGLCEAYLDAFFIADTQLSDALAYLTNE